MALHWRKTLSEQHLGGNIVLEDSPKYLSGALGLFVVTLFFLKVIYNICFHPLSTIPGPWLAKVFGSYLLPDSVALRRSKKLLQLHRKYGSVVRVGPNEVSVSDWSALRVVYNDKITTKSDSFYSAAQFTGPYDNIFSMRNKEAHRARRKLENHSYSQQVIFQNEKLISEKTDILVRRIVTAAKESISGKTVEVFKLSGLLSLEVILKCALNRNYGESPDGDSLTLLKAMEGSAAGFAIKTTLPWIDRHYGQFIPGFFGHSFKQFNLFVDMTKRLEDQFIREELEADATTMKFMATSLLNNVDTYLGRKLTEQEVLEELVGLIFAGSGTTSTVFTYLLWCLAKNQNIQELLRQELQGAGTTLGELQQLPLLNAVIKETHRLHPSLMGFLPRTLDQPVVIGKHRLPTGTLVAMQNFVHQRDHTLYPEPDSWCPERWLHETKDMNSALTPFSVGPRNCIGQNLAKAELYLSTSKVVRKLRLSVNMQTRDSDMDMEERGPVAIPKGKRLLLDIDVLD